MTKNIKLVWRLSTRPTVDEVLKLVEKKLLTNEEAKQILFSSETEETKDIKSLEAKIKFLEEVIEGLTRGVSRVEIIRQTPIYYKQWDWFGPTVTWCSSINNQTASGTVN